jgi:hypothetical protein
MKKTIFLSVACLIASVAFSQSVVLYDGETVSPNWTNIAGQATVTNNVDNPDKTGVNTSDKVIKVERAYTNDSWEGGRIYGQDISLGIYNRLSVMVWKNVAGNVKIEVQRVPEGGGEEDKDGYTLRHDGNGWQEFVFDIHCRSAKINNFLLFVHDHDESGNVDFGTKEMYIDNVKAYFDAGATWYHDFNVSATNEIVLYNGDDLKPFFGDLAAQVNRDATNPVTNGINTSTGCASITRKANGEGDNAQNHSGGALWGCEKMYLNPAQYNRFSLEVLKPVEGLVKLEIQTIDGGNAFLEANYTTPNAWQKLVFEVPKTWTTPINNILVEIHYQEYAGEDALMYWDNLTAYQSPLVIPAETSRPAPAYKGGNIIFHEGSQLTNIPAEGLAVSGKVIYKRTFTPCQWHTIGFPFDIADVYVEAFKDEEDGGHVVAWNSTAGDYLLKAYSGDATFDFTQEWTAGKGYIIQFPSDFAGKEVSFISTDSPTLYNTATSVTAVADGYSLIANPSVDNRSNTSGITGAEHYYVFELEKENHFGLADGKSFTLKPFESVIVTKGVTNLRSSVAVETPTEINVVPANDPIKEVRYYNLQGVEIAGAQFIAPTQCGVFIVKTVYESGAVNVSKIIRK